MIKVISNRPNRIYQGDIFRDVEYIEGYSISEKDVEISRIIFPLVIVLTQDCDLSQDSLFRSSQDKSQDKYLISVLVAPLYNAEHFFEGNHLDELSMVMQKIKIGSTVGNKLIQNETPRYHYLKFSEDIPLPPTIIDFKHYFSVNINSLMKIKKSNCVCQVSELYREDISHRFSSFLSRIGLPVHEDECEVKN